MSDYAQMTNAEINRAVAIRLGWRVKREDGGGGAYYRLYAPGQTAPQATVGTRVGSAWHALMERARECGNNVPDWATDANAALSVVESNTFLHLTLVLPHDDELWTATVGFARDVTARATTPARAICEAWLTYMEAVEGQDKDWPA